ncbi:MAG: transcription elongation factor GreA [Clostridiales bacterium GWE2_32_10]|nr:MAG: transcription elongation factor GreA [Clostridiales bacterium GWE2_32_10]HBY19886.1 transcription elongation factor GreA [Clostridiales bacterium]
MENIILTVEGMKKLENELEELKTIKRHEIAEKIKEARMQGDLSENAEYDAAKEEQAEMEVRIIKIENILRHAEVIDETKVDTKKINIGCRVTVKYIDSGEEEDYWIVGSTESDVLENKVSNESPIGLAMLGHKKGDIVKVNVPTGSIEVEIIKIHR